MSVSKSIPFLGKVECLQHSLNPLGVDHYSSGGGGGWFGPDFRDFL